LVASRTRKSSTSPRVVAPKRESYAACSSEIPSTARQARSTSSAGCGSSEVDRVTSSMRAVFSARSM